MATRKKVAKKAATKGAATKPTSRKRPSADDAAAQQIDKRIDELGGWRGETLARMRSLILEADPGVTEEWKWSNPVWSRDGIICTGEAYAKTVKLTFARGASLPDPTGLFNSSLEGNTRRAIDIREGEMVDARAFKALIKAAVAHNGSAGKAARPATGRKKPVRLLSGGNPQIAKADGDAPVQEFIAAMPGWKRKVGERIDKLIERTVPDVRKAVKWNTPMYGTADLGFFLAFHVFERYVKVTFFRGTELRPLPPDPSKDRNTRYVNVHEGRLDEVQMGKWVKQAAKLKGYLA